MATLHDLFEYRHPRIMNPIQAWFEQRGLEFIDSGALAATFRNKSGEIVKVFDNDPCYRRFIALVQKHSDNPHLPRVRKLAEFRHPDLKGAFMIKLEPLQRISFREWINNTGLHCYVVVEHNLFSPNLVNRVDVPTAIWEILGGDPMRDSQALQKARDIADQFQRDNPLFIKALNLVLFNRTRNCRIDLHDGNFMKRGDTWVITDPYIE